MSPWVISLQMKMNCIYCIYLLFFIFLLSLLSFPVFFVSFLNFLKKVRNMEFIKDMHQKYIKRTILSQLCFTICTVKYTEEPWILYLYAIIYCDVFKLIQVIIYSRSPSPQSYQHRVSKKKFFMHIGNIHVTKWINK